MLARVTKFAAVAALAWGTPDGDDLAADDECDGQGPDASACGLNAVQLRAVKREETAKNTSLAEREAESDPITKLSLTSMCFAYTGGTCKVEDCNEERGAECVQGKCMCSGCSGADGKCRDEKNTKLAEGFLLRNAKYEHYKMYFQRVSTFGQMKTTRMYTSMNMGQDKFDLIELPGEKDGHKEYFLASAKWKDYVVGFKATTGTALSPFAAYAVDLETKASLLDAWGPSNIMLRICQTGQRSSWKGGIQIGAALSPTDSKIWAYVHGGSWFVYGSVTRPAEGGTWMPDPPLPEDVYASLPVCE